MERPARKSELAASPVAAEPLRPEEPARSRSTPEVALLTGIVSDVLRAKPLRTSSHPYARVLKAQKRDLSAWREGRYLEVSSGRTEDLRSRGAADRLELAVRFRRQADRMLKMKPPLYRDAVSRYYYSMYHAMRAVVFYVESGDDFQEHSELPKRTPKRLPQLPRSGRTPSRTPVNAVMPRLRALSQIDAGGS